MLVGAGGVGKSSIIIRYTQNKFDTNIQSTTGIDFL
jgi:GTPase SAR1 family protein